MEATEKVKSEESQVGASMIEYALIAALIAAVCIGSMTFLGGQVSKRFSSVASSFNNLN